METRASYILVGTFVLLLIAGAFAFVIWLSKVEFEQRPARYVIYFTGSVSGLQIGGPVRYRGVPVGSVTEIRIDPKNVERIEVTLEVATDTPIKRDTFASLGLQGITGAAYVQLSGGTQKSPALVAKKGEPPPEIASKPSRLERVLTKAPELIEQAFELVERLSGLLNEGNQKAVSETLGNMREVSENLVASSGKFDRILTEATVTVISLRQAAERIDGLTSSLEGRLGPLADSARDAMTDLQTTIAGFRATAQSFTEVANLLEEIIGENREPLQDFSGQGLYELSQFIAEARVLVSDLTRLAVQVERDPARFFFGDAQKGFEAR